MNNYLIIEIKKDMNEWTNENMNIWKNEWINKLMN